MEAATPSFEMEEHGSGGGGGGTGKPIELLTLPDNVSIGKRQPSDGRVAVLEQTDLGTALKLKLNHLMLPESSHFFAHTILELVTPFMLLIITTDMVMLSWKSPNNARTMAAETTGYLVVVDLMFTCIYTLECLLRCAAYGVVAMAPPPQVEVSGAGDITPQSPTDREAEAVASWKESQTPFFGSGWNWLDFVVICSAWTSYAVQWLETDIESAWGQVFRALRVLRVMHTFRYLSAVRAILQSLSECAAYMRNVFGVFMFFYAIYAIVGFQLFGGVLRTECVAPNATDVTVAPADGVPTTGIFQWAGSYGQVVTCPKSSSCPADGKTCRIVPGEGGTEYVGFDNFAVSVLTLIVATTGDNWNDLAWQLTNSNSTNAALGYGMVFSMQIVLAILCVNLFTATICSTFGDVRAAGADSAFVENAAFQDHHTGDTSSSDDEEEDDLPDWEETVLLPYAADEDRQARLHRLRGQKVAKEKVQGKAAKRARDHRISRGLDPDEWKVARPIRWSRPPYQSNWLERFTEKTAFDLFITSCILMNTISLGSVTANMSQTKTDVLAGFENIFTVIFLGEMGVKILALGLRRYLMDNFNKMDFVVNGAVVGGQAYALYAGSGGGGGFVKATRMLRLLRVFRAARITRLLYKYPSVRSLVKTMLGSYTAVINLSMFLIFNLTVFALLGVHMLGDDVQFKRALGENGTLPGVEYLPNYPKCTHRSTDVTCISGLDKKRAHFSNFLHAYTTCFVMLTGDRWKVTMFSYMESYGWEASIFFVLVFVVGNFIILNLFVAVVLENFGFSDPERIAMQKQRFIEKYDPDLTKGWVESGVIRIGHWLDGMQILDIFGSHPDEDGFAEEKALLLFSKGNSIRKMAKRVQKHPIFDALVLLLITVSVVMVTIENPPGTLPAEWRETFDQIDSFLLVVFWFEAMLRSISMGFLFQESAYLHEPWNMLDFTVVLATTSTRFLEGRAKELAGVVKIMRLLRVLRIFNRYEGMRVIVKAIATSLKAVWAIAALTLLVYMIFGIAGVSLFGGKFYRCNNDWVWGRADCVGSFIMGDSGVVTAPTWANPGFHFDNIGAAMSTLFTINTLSGWSDCLYTAMDVTEVGQQPVKDAFAAASIYFLTFLFAAAFFVVNLFIGVLFNLLGTETGQALETEAQRKWVIIQVMMSGLKVYRPVSASNSVVRNFCLKLVQNSKFDVLIIVTIIFNVLLMCTGNWPTPTDLDPSLPDTWFVVKEHLNLGCLVIFTIEAAAKITALGPTLYIDDSWNRLDLFIVVTSWSGAEFTRPMRVARIVLLLKHAKNLRIIFSTFIVSLPATGNIVMLLLLLFLFYSNVGMFLFGHTKYVSVYNGLGNFRSVGSSMLMLLQLCSGQDIIFFISAFSLDEHGTFDGHTCTPAVVVDNKIISYGDCGNSWAAWPFVASFFAMANYLLINMIIAVVMENFDFVQSMSTMEISEDDLQKFINVWDKRVTQDLDSDKLPMDQLQSFLEALGEPLGYDAPVAPRFLNLVLHELEDMWPAPPSVGVTRKELLLTLSMMYLSTECLSYEERIAKLKSAARDRAAKILICSVRSWHKKAVPPEALKGDPQAISGYSASLDAARRWRMIYLCRVYKKGLKDVIKREPEMLRIAPDLNNLQVKPHSH